MKIELLESDTDESVLLKLREAIKKALSQEIAPKYLLLHGLIIQMINKMDLLRLSDRNASGIFKRVYLFEGVEVISCNGIDLLECYLLN